VDDYHPVHTTRRFNNHPCGRRWTTTNPPWSLWPAKMGDTPQSTAPITAITRF